VLKKNRRYGMPALPKRELLSFWSGDVPENMASIYDTIRQRARQIVSSFPAPDFYKDFSRADELSRNFLNTDPVIAQLRTFVGKHIEDDFGHGLKHSIMVAIDAGTLMIVEGELEANAEHSIDRSVLIVQTAGLLHDIKRKHKDHAIRGAAYAKEVLEAYPFSTNEVEDICQAIQGHEAFKDNIKINTPEGALVSDCLYDADKFRWGPDNFTDTVWDMVSFFNPPFSKFITHYPKGMEGLARVKHTFRTKTGKKYGPQFIDLGLAIGEEIYKTIKTEFSHLL
jgi:hypothetical protein